MKDTKIWLTSSSLLAVFTESIDCDNGWDCMGFCPICPTGSILLLLVVVFGVVTELVIVAVVADDATELLLLATLIFDADVVLLLFCTNPCVVAAIIAELFCCCVANAACDGLKLDDVLIDLICCCWCWAVAIKLGICVGIVPVGVEVDIIDLICVNAGDFAASGNGKFCNIGEACGWWWRWWWWWKGAKGWCGCWKFATAAAAAVCDANK